VINLILGSEIIQWLLGGLGAFAAILFYGRHQRRKGKKEVLREAQEADHENASEINDRVERHLDQRVREMDGRGYRD